TTSSRTAHRRPNKPPPVTTDPKPAKRMGLSDDDFDPKPTEMMPSSDNNFAEAPSLELHGQPPVATRVTFHVGDRFASF
ncbi:unnamed protein product, partial [Ixodes persulcatus]